MKPLTLQEKVQRLVKQEPVAVFDTPEELMAYLDRTMEVPAPACESYNWYLAARRAYELRRMRGLAGADTDFLYEMLHSGEPCCRQYDRIRLLT